jgi:predicted DNA-binding transcriptional regulator AlpA
MRAKKTPIRARRRRRHFEKPGTGPLQLVPGTILRMLQVIKVMGLGESTIFNMMETEPPNLLRPKLAPCSRKCPTGVHLAGPAKVVWLISALSHVEARTW